MNLSNKSKQIILISLTILAVVLLVINAAIFAPRLDMTTSRIYSLSKATKKITRDIPEHLNITYYLSDKLKDKVPAFNDIEDMVLEYAKVSKGKISVTIENADKIQPTNKLQQDGLQPFPLEESGAAEFKRTVVYSGIVLDYLGKKDVLPVVVAQESLEYQLALSIKKLVFKQERKVGLLPASEEYTIDNNFYFIKRILEQSYKVEEVIRDKKIDKSLNALIVLGEVKDDYQLLVIDQYLMEGGAVLFLTDRQQASYTQYGLMGQKVDNKLVDLLEFYGVRIKENLIADSSCNAALMPTQSGITIVKYPYFFKIPGANASKTHPVTAKFSGLNLLWASPLELTESAKEKTDVVYEELVKTTKNSWQVPLTNSIDFNQAMFMLEQDTEETKASIPVAYSVSGSIESYFADKTLPKKEGEAAEFSTIKNKAVDSRFIVVGDKDFVSLNVQDQTMLQIYQMFNIELEQKNLAFLLNSVEWLAADEDLMGIRVRIARNTSLDSIQNPGVKAAYYIFVQIICMVIVPLTVIIIGLTRIIIRKKRARSL